MFRQYIYTGGKKSGHLIYMKKILTANFAIFTGFFIFFHLKA